MSDDSMIHHGRASPPHCHACTPLLVATSKAAVTVRTQSSQTPDGFSCSAAADQYDNQDDAGHTKQHSKPVLLDWLIWLARRGLTTARW